MSIKNTDTVQTLYDNLPSFYKEFIYDDKFIKYVLDSYVEVVGFLIKYAKSVYYNTSIGTAELYRKIDMGVITLRNSLYNVNDVAQKFTAVGYGDWFNANTSIGVKVQFLDSLGLYDELDTRRLWDEVPGEIISLSIMKDFSEDLGYYRNNVDYVISKNKLYVFNALAKPVTSGVKKVLAKNIHVKMDKLENRWGTFFETLTKDYMAPFEYKDFLKALITFKPTIAQIRAVSNTLDSIPSIQLRDLYSIKNYPKELLRSSSTLGPFDFTYRIPSEFLDVLYYIPPGYEVGALSPPYELAVYDIDYYDEVAKSVYYSNLAGKVKNLRNFLDLIKPAYTNYSLKGSMSISDTVADEFVDTVSTTTNSPLMDSWHDDGSGEVQDNVTLHLISSTGVYGESTYGEITYSGTL